jgi:hypothetical protein
MRKIGRNKIGASAKNQNIFPNSGVLDKELREISHFSLSSNNIFYFFRLI